MSYFLQSPKETRKFLQYMKEDLDNIERVLDSIDQNDVDPDFIVHPKSETVDESAKNTEISKERIVKTLIFIAENPIAVLCPGNKKVSEEKLEKILDTNTRMAEPQEVREYTGYEIGGVSPFDLEIPVYMAEKILEREEVRPAAGSRLMGIKISSQKLKQINNAEVKDLTR